jgi:hypothetical protein
VSAADGWGRAGSGRGEGRAGAWAMGRLGHEGGGSASAREREGVWARNGPAVGEFSFFFFYFLILISISYFYSFYPLFF